MSKKKLGSALFASQIDASVGNGDGSGLRRLKTSHTKPGEEQTGKQMNVSVWFE